jgi:hypothetical protein
LYFGTVKLHLKVFFLSDAEFKDDHMDQFRQASSSTHGDELFLQIQLLRSALNEAVVFNGLMKSATRQVSSDHHTAMLQSYSRLFVLYERAGGNVTPKFHLMLHAIGQVPTFGCPKYFATYVDESFNGVLANIAKSCHKLTWAESIFNKLSAINQLDARRLAGFGQKHS